jgi:tetratricopeptide (TPR) repeat protein
VKLFYEWDWAGAECELKTALKLNPKLALAHSVYALFLSGCGRYDEALAEARLGRDLEPLSIFSGMGVCWALHTAGRSETARDEALRVRELVPGFEEAGNVLINAYESLGQLEEAARVMARQRSWCAPLDGDVLLAAYREGDPRILGRSPQAPRRARLRAAPDPLSIRLVHLQLGGWMTSITSNGSSTPIFPARSSFHSTFGSFPSGNTRVSKRS